MSSVSQRPRNDANRNVIPLGRATRAWFLISLQTFGGPAGQIAVMQRTLVDENRWLGERRFLHALSYCMLLPGPEAQQLAIYTGWLLNGWAGGVIAGVLFVLPGMLALLALSWVYVSQGDTVLVEALFLGLAPAVLAIVVQAVVRVGGRVLRHRALWLIALASFAALAVFSVPFPLVILAAAFVGWALGRWRPAVMAPPPPPGDDGGPAPLIPDDALHRAAPSARRNLAVLAGGIVLWLLPVLVAFLLTSRDSVFVQMGTFFSGTALVTFGGAYAVLAFVAQKAVESYGWLTGGEMVRGLALAESTPGPLIMVLQFVAFLGAYRDPGSLDPLTAAVIASLLVTWVTFVPSFLFIFLGAPYVERLRENRTLAAALTGVTAAVVGVIANLAVFFGVHTLGEWRSAVIAPVAFALVFWLRWPMLRVLAVCAVLGVVVGLLTV
jgi:chromate transporter